MKPEFLSQTEHSPCPLWSPFV